MGAEFWDYWYFHIPDLILVALIYVMLARAVIGLVLPTAWDNRLWQAFQRATAPVLVAVGLVTPRSTPTVLCALFGALWLALARVGFIIAMVDLGLAPGLGASAV